MLSLTPERSTVLQPLKQFQEVESGCRSLIQSFLSSAKGQIAIPPFFLCLLSGSKVICCSGNASCLSDVKVATKNKVPLVRSLTLNWVTFCIETSNKAAVLKLHKDYVPICMECLNDGTPEVRDAAFSALAAVAKLVGMRPLERSLEKLDEVRKKKLSEMIGTTGSGQVPVAPPSGTSRVISSGSGFSASEVGS
eukprot:Gb_07657 [translate_table: standard]